MSEAEQKRLLSKQEEAQAKIKQAEADLYFLQGYLKALEELLAEAENGNERNEN